MTRKQLISALLLAGMLATVSCGGGAGTGEGSDTTPGGGNDTTPPAAEGYDYQGKDFGEYDFTMLNLDVQYDSFIRFDFEESSSDQLEEAVYRRNRYVEDQLNITLHEAIIPRGAEWQTGQAAVCEALQNQVMADDDDYDAAFLPLMYKRDIISTEYLIDLATVPEMHVFEEYWDKGINEQLTIKNKILFASGPLNMMTFDTAWICLFNERLMDDLKLDYPYDLVREGKWTVDKFGEYTAAGANLNGAETFQFNPDGDTTYGIVAHTSTPGAMFSSMGISGYSKNSDGEIVLDFSDERYFTALEKLADYMSIVNGNAYFNNGDINSTNGYISSFNAGRGLFLGAQLKDTSPLRAMEDSFGILPYPKYDEAQENHITVIGTGSEFLAIPTTQDDVSRTGFILDALTYESWEDVLPIFYNVTLSQKDLRNDNSLDMLEVIWESRTINANGVFGIPTPTSKLGELISGGTGITTASSIIATVETSAQTTLETFLENFD